MFFLVPYAVDVPYDRRPVTNWLLIISVIAAFCFQFASYDGGELEKQAFSKYVLDGWHWEGLLGHMWLHGDPLHLAGNMLFLWVFGNAVCAKVGNFKYLPIYLFVGLGAAAGHLLFHGDPAVGASGAINGIVGMFLVFFWQNEMDCVFFMFIFLRPIYKTFSISSYWMIGLWLLFDIFGALTGGGRIAYFAHLGGFFSGAVLAVLLLKFNLVTMYRDEQSLIGLFEQWRQGREDAKLEEIARQAIEKTNHTADLQDSPAQKQPSERIEFVCSCGQRFNMPIQHAGKKGLCPKCRQPITVPRPASSVDSV